MIWRTLLACATMVSAGLVGPALGDGKLFSAAEDMREPNQKALLWLDGGRETLILQVKYEGGAGEFGWVVPVPGRPKLDTAPSTLFYELAVVTRPEIVAPRGSRGGRTGGGQPAGVSELEHMQVGVYDATVLAASDPEALAGWLRRHGYRMPDGAEKVLQSYVGRGWFYLAMRIDVRRLEADLLRVLTDIDPGIKTLDDAPKRLGELLVRTLDSRGANGAAVATAIGKALDDWARQAGGAGEGRVSARIMNQSALEGAYKRAARGPALVTEEWPYRVRSSSYLQCLEHCSTTLGMDKVQAAAEGAGLAGEGGLEGLELRVYDSVNRDLRAGVPYPQSRVGEFQAALLKASPSGDLPGNLLSEADYNGFLEVLANTRAVPPPSPEEVQALERSQGMSSPMIVVKARSELYREVGEALRNARGTLDAALSSGTIQPVRMEFDANQLVYPLHISSLGRGETDVQVYVLSDHRMQAKGFRTAFASPLGEQLQTAPELAKLVGRRTKYLTELRAKMTPEQMGEDVTLTRAESDAAFRERVTPEGEVLTRGQAAIYGRTGSVVSLRPAARDEVLAGVLVLAVGALVVIRRRRNARS